ncbi:MAG TPA: SAM-dependent chlorinase/fluorinase [Verrucomicrobiae bacterium]|nr:SAM-dependent chlorinase/fluorinase [Verrucomicrobiae bacterium]
MRCITLTTDFGTRDWFVGTMKGVILSLAPNARIVDLTHEIAPGDVQAGAYALAAAYAFFPRHTIHVAVVDPGVGTSRRAIAVQTSNYFFVGPDNGLFSRVLTTEKVIAIHQLKNERYFLNRVSATFHGRDVFAPVAAHLSQGAEIGKVGPLLDDYVRLKSAAPKMRHGAISGEVQYVDRFGNAITNIPAAALARVGAAAKVFLNNKPVCRIGPAYQSVPENRPVAVVGSTGFLELAINGASAAQAFGLKPGTRIELRTTVRRKGPLTRGD